MIIGVCPRCHEHAAREGGFLCVKCLLECEQWIAHEGNRYKDSHKRIVVEAKCGACGKARKTGELRIDESAKGGAVYRFTAGPGSECKCDAPALTLTVTRTPLNLK